MFGQLLSTLNNETPFFHTPLIIEKGELRNIKQCHIVNARGAYWQTKIKIDEKIETDETQYTAPWFLPHYSISLSFWDSKKEEMQFILAIYKKDFFDISDICSPSSLDDWDIVQSYIKKNEEKQYVDGKEFLIKNIFPLIREN